MTVLSLTWESPSLGKTLLYWEGSLDAFTLHKLLLAFVLGRRWRCIIMAEPSLPLAPATYHQLLKHCWECCYSEKDWWWFRLWVIGFYQRNSFEALCMLGSFISLPYTQWRRLSDGKWWYGKTHCFVYGHDLFLFEPRLGTNIANNFQQWCYAIEFIQWSLFLPCLTMVCVFTLPFRPASVHLSVRPSVHKV